MQAPRVNQRGSELPSPRQLSNNLKTSNDVPSRRNTVLLMVFGQFVDHDVDHVPVENLNCCNDAGGFADAAFSQARCFPIKIPVGDPFFRKSCMNFVRSDCAPRLDCSPGPLEQVNQITHWLDSSNVYGSDEEEARELRYGYIDQMR